MSDIPLASSDDDKEVYAFAGLALYAANLVEASLINLAVGLRLDKVQGITREVFESTFSGMERKTLGSLLAAARAHRPFDADTDVVLESALTKRNELVHAFFREHGADLTHRRGRAHLIEALREMIALFQRADRLLTPIYEDLWVKFGITPEFVERELAEMRREIEAKYAREF